jgi:hypothetical protein
MSAFFDAGAFGAALAVALAAAAAALVALGLRTLRGGEVAAGWWLLFPALLICVGELGVLAGAAAAPGHPAGAAAGWAALLARRALALGIAGRLLLVIACAQGLSRAVLPGPSAIYTFWRAVAASAAAGVGFAVMVNADASAGRELARALSAMGSHADSFSLAAALGAVSCALTALRTTPDAQQARVSVGVAGLAMLGALALSAAERTAGDVLALEALAAGVAPPPASAALRTYALHLGQGAVTVIGLAALPALLATDRSLFELVSPRRVLAAAAVLAVPIALSLSTRAPLQPAIDALRDAAGAPADP